ncbi:MAG: hypothetical protein ACFUZC_04825 [Chthoniobacteraceae bacterium]
MSAPENYETKFADFLKLIEDSKASGVEAIVVAAPWVLGDNYEEIVESLSRIAKAGLALRIAEGGR